MAHNGTRKRKAHLVKCKRGGGAVGGIVRWVKGGGSRGRTVGKGAGYKLTNLTGTCKKDWVPEENGEQGKTEVHGNVQMYHGRKGTTGLKLQGGGGGRKDNGVGSLRFFCIKT